MKKMKRFASAALAAQLLAGSAPSALALIPHRRCISSLGTTVRRRLVQSNDWEWYMLDYDEVSDIYRTALQELKLTRRALNAATSTAGSTFDLAIEYGIWDSRVMTICVMWHARSFTKRTMTCASSSPYS